MYCEFLITIIRSAYTASKHAIQAFADCLRAEIRQDGISVLVVSPGYVKTNLSLNALSESGEKYGKLDKETANGFSSEFVAERTYRALLNREKDVVIATFVQKGAIFLQKFCTEIFYFIMAKRAQHSKKMD